MKLNRYLILLTFLVSSCLCQAQFSDLSRKYFAKKCHWDFDVNVGLFLFPVYDLASSTPYKLDGQKIKSSDVEYYCAVPGKKIWNAYTTDPLDQGTLYYFSLTPYCDSPFFNYRKRFKIIFGITHDKAQQSNDADPSQPFFRLNDGGGEFTVKLSYSWHIAQNIKEAIHDSNEHLIIDFSVDAGGFICLNEDSAHIYNLLDNGLLITNRYNAFRNPMDRRFEGYGFLGNVSGNFGYNRPKWRITVGYYLGFEYQHNRVVVTEGSSDNHHLTVNTAAIFLTPTLNFVLKNDFWRSAAKSIKKIF